MVNFEHRTFADILAHGDGRIDEKPFRAIHRLSKMQANAYETYLRPFVKASSNELSAEMIRTLHPLRLQRRLWSSKNPMAMWVSQLAEQASTPTSATEENHAANSSDTTDAEQQREHEQGSDGGANLNTHDPLPQDNPFLQLEKLWVNSLMMSLDVMRDMQAIMSENLFFGLWATPWMRGFGRVESSRRLLNADDLKTQPKVQAALAKLEQGGLREAIVRMLILTDTMNESGIDRDKLLLIVEVFNHSKPFDELSKQALAEMLHEQMLIVRFDPEGAKSSLIKLLPKVADRKMASKVLRYVMGKQEDLTLDSRRALASIHEVLSLKDKDVEEDVDTNPMQT